MTLSSFEAIIRALDKHQVRYLIVGGLAVVAHGLDRFTADVDIVLAVDDQNMSWAVAAFQSLGYAPRAPVPFEQFVDPAKRRQWATEKNMMVFSLFAPQHDRTEVDLFLEPPFDFDAAYNRSIVQPITGGLTARFCGIDDLLELKVKAGRPHDLLDIAQLRELHGKSTP